MLKLAVLAAAAASATTSPALVSTAPWWEKVTVTIAGDGKPQSCQYEASHPGSASSECAVEDAQAGSVAEAAKTTTGSLDQFTKITFERRFIPGDTQPTKAEIQPGDTLLGGQVMALAIDKAGEVQGCKVVARAGDVAPDYGCDEATAEKFEASVGDHSEPPAQGYMTILVYGHQENLA